MSVIAETTRMTVEEYLAFEEHADERHEFLGGVVTAMAGNTKRHNEIVLNLAEGVRPQLRGGPCRAFAEQIKVRVEAGESVFYYPDFLVTCDPRDLANPAEVFVQYPKVIIEVLSPATERIDRREKFFAYLQIPTLEEYVLLSQSAQVAMGSRRENGWKEELSTEVLELRSLGLRLPLAELYAGIDFSLDG